MCDMLEVTKNNFSQVRLCKANLTNDKLHAGGGGVLVSI